MSAKAKRLIVGMSGASGAVYGIRLLEVLKGSGIQTHLVMSKAAKITLVAETDFKVSDVERLATVVHSNEDIGAACASGSFHTVGMVVAPCSVKTMSEIPTGVTSHLLSRAAASYCCYAKHRCILVIFVRWRLSRKRARLFFHLSQPSMLARYRLRRWSIILSAGFSIFSISMPGLCHAGRASGRGRRPRRKQRNSSSLFARIERGHGSAART